MEFTKKIPINIYHPIMEWKTGNVDRDLDQEENLIEVYHKSIMNNQYILSRITIIQVVLNF